jgi:hypothetical protein
MMRCAYASAIGITSARIKPIGRVGCPYYLGIILDMAVRAHTFLRTAALRIAPIGHAQCTAGDRISHR